MVRKFHISNLKIKNLKLFNFLKMGNKGFQSLEQSKRCEEIVKNINVKYSRLASLDNASSSIVEINELFYRKFVMPTVV
jgi:hypothetical protein